MSTLLTVLRRIGVGAFRFSVLILVLGGIPTLVIWLLMGNAGDAVALTTLVLLVGALLYGIGNDS